jgi:mono/diheme cytochrome c family protein
MKAFLRAAVVLILIVAAAGGVVAYSIARRGLSARAEPTAAEAYIARTMRQLATPAAVRTTKNPVTASEAVLAEGLEHFADHCATCHANNGSGDTAIGRGMYPRPPDMRTGPTQALTDGELFAIIENGIRLSGMPAWGDGTPEGERASWVLVHFIRRLPKLTADELRRMEKPASPAPHKHGEPKAPHQHGASK